ncbi:MULTISPECIES: glucosylglycerol 3-phosphatase [unclassified Oceanobacter]|uniref:glucosylglycerol 3-phosphatase n=1 Tax=unclassified Oceanobacter TaxID=2620260 RepID=UPI00273323B4|nr:MULTISPECIES: glucosylglycerol 3-phosphatase [unclassified Oceanobacter]MDP2609749.1 glucosylglycerol 3-phosphatase [Oceanobacter sp. 1_MG-2023]MDP2613080.1 glucosylglycerol 3-phosphatase [Oceanobacter sp. 2_MG-2023]
MSPDLSSYQWHTDTSPLADALAAERDYLIIQDLDGVCMGLVNDPLSRTMDPDYIQAVRQQAGHFYVLTNGEHIGKRGVNPIVDRALGDSTAKQQGLYLPGLGAGGVQLQDRFGKVTHPGVSSAEMAFLLQIPVKARYFLINLLGNTPYNLAKENIHLLADAVVLDNRASPTINANLLCAVLGSVSSVTRLQHDLQSFMAKLLLEAQAQGMGDSFFIHYAPNLGTDPVTGQERIKPADGNSWGTTDFQFMLTGAVKESGVLVLLNQYYAAKTGVYPLGEDFSARSAPGSHAALLALSREAFDPAQMPRIIGVGDTITSHRVGDEWQRGGSDRGFLTLVQDLGRQFESDNVVLLVDSSGGEVIRPSVDVDALQQHPADHESYWQAVAGLSDPADPLQVNFVCAGGYPQYLAWFRHIADLIH